MTRTPNHVAQIQLFLRRRRSTDVDSVVSSIMRWSPYTNKTELLKAAAQVKAHMASADSSPAASSQTFEKEEAKETEYNAFKKNVTNNNRKSSLLAAATAVAATAAASADFESKHPRNKDGEFTDKGKGQGGEANKDNDNNVNSKKLHPDAEKWVDKIAYNYPLDEKLKTLDYIDAEFAEKISKVSFKDDITKILRENLIGVNNWDRSAKNPDGEKRHWFNPDYPNDDHFEDVDGDKVQDWRDYFQEGKEDELRTILSKDDFQKATAVYKVEKYMYDQYEAVRQNVKYVTRTAESKEIKTWAEGHWPDFHFVQRYMSMSFGTKPLYYGDGHDGHVVFEVTDDMRKSMITPWRRMYGPSNVNDEKLDDFIGADEEYLMEVKTELDYFDFKVHSFGVHG